MGNERKGCGGEWTEVRFYAISSGIIPRKYVENLSREQLAVFLREEDPNRWPASLGNLTQFAELHKRQ